MKQLSYLFLLVVVLSSFYGCDNKKEKTNDEQLQVNSENYSRLTKEELVPILKDVLLLESALYFKANQGSEIKTLTYFYYNQIFLKYNISRNQFYNSIKYYLQKDAKASVMFLGAINMLTVETDSIRKSQTSLKEVKVEEANNSNDKKTINFFGKRPK